MPSIFADRTREQLEADAGRYLNILDIWQQEAVELADNLGSPAVRELMERVKARISELPKA